MSVHTASCGLFYGLRLQSCTQTHGKKTPETIRFHTGRPFYYVSSNLTISRFLRTAFVSLHTNLSGQVHMVADAVLLAWLEVVIFETNKIVSCIDRWPALLTVIATCVGVNAPPELYFYSSHSFQRYIVCVYINYLKGFDELLLAIIGSRHRWSRAAAKQGPTPLVL